eukprot:6002964-Pleurochrysis_carterae.AAC.1
MHGSEGSNVSGVRPLFERWTRRCEPCTGAPCPSQIPLLPRTEGGRGRAPPNQRVCRPACRRPSARAHPSDHGPPRAARQRRRRRPFHGAPESENRRA